MDSIYIFLCETISNSDLKDDKYYNDVVKNRKSANITKGTLVATAGIGTPIGAYKFRQFVKSRKSKLVQRLALPAAIFGYLTLFLLSLGIALHIDKLTAKLYRRKIQKKGPKFFYTEKLKYIEKAINTIQREIAWLKKPETKKEYELELTLQQYNKDLKSLNKTLQGLNKEKTETLKKLIELQQ
jgi:hypothetical protein